MVEGQNQYFTPLCSEVEDAADDLGKEVAIVILHKYLENRI